MAAQYRQSHAQLVPIYFITHSIKYLMLYLSASTISLCPSAVVVIAGDTSATPCLRPNRYSMTSEIK